MSASKSASDDKAGQGRETSVSSESQASSPGQTSGQGRQSSASAGSPSAAPDTKPEAQGRETPSSANPDHSGGKVDSGDQKADGSVAATEEEKGGSSE